MTERITLDADQPAEAFTADVPARRIRGLAIPANATATKAGRTWRFLPESVAFGARTPLLAYHDTTRPVGLLTSSRWTAERGLEVEFTVSKTPAGDEALQLAADGVLGLSVGIDVPTGGARQVGDEFRVSRAHAAEVSLTPCPAFAGSVIDSVALMADAPERTPAMPDDTLVTPAPAATVALDADALGAAIGRALMAQATPPGPVPVPVPATARVSEEAPYRFDGVGGRHGLVADALASSRGDGEATQRLNTFLAETFAVTTANVAGLNPPTNRPDLYRATPDVRRPLAGLISTGNLTDGTPFILPKFGSASGLVAPFVEGVEPTPGEFTATSQTITPGALAGKAEISRPVWDAGGNPKVDALVWNEMLAASAEAAEERVAAMLDGLALTPVAVSGTGAAVVDDVTAELTALQFQRRGNRFSSLALAEDLYTALVGAKDADGRKLLPVLGPTNADGTVDPGFGALRIGNATGIPAWGLNANSYLIVPSSVYQFISPPKKLIFDVHVRSVYIGLFQYAAEAVIRDADVIRLTYTA